MKPLRSFSPAGKIFPVEETIGQRLARLARASLPCINVETGVRRRRTGQRFCVCGDQLHKNPKVRQGQPVCDDCAKIIPRLPGGRGKCMKNKIK